MLNVCFWCQNNIEILFLCVNVIFKMANYLSFCSYRDNSLWRVLQNAPNFRIRLNCCELTSDPFVT